MPWHVQCSPVFETSFFFSNMSRLNTLFWLKIEIYKTKKLIFIGIFNFIRNADEQNGQMKKKFTKMIENKFTTPTSMTADNYVIFGEIRWSFICLCMPAIVRIESNREKEKERQSEQMLSHQCSKYWRVVCHVKIHWL